MHETLIPDIKGHIDQHSATGASGWTLYPGHTVRALAGDDEIPIEISERPDVASFYKTNIGFCVGWRVRYSPEMDVRLQIRTTGKWTTVFVLNKQMASYNFNVGPLHPPTCIVVDGFYEKPDDVRAFALQCVFHGDSKYHKGARTAETYRFPGLKERFEQILGRPVLNWEKYGTNGCFQFCIGGDQIVYHHDTQQYAGVLYLTPDAPVGAGTSLFRAKKTKEMNGFDAVYADTYPTGHLDPAAFDCVDTVGNVYNRLILFDSRMIHAASSYFGDSKENGRLFQLFFFDLVSSVSSVSST